MSRFFSSLLCLTVFVSAFLLFQIQPIIARFVLPWFGGTPMVWSACLLFFQVVLLAGYLYAHILYTHLRPCYQGFFHAVLLLLVAYFLNVMPGAEWKPNGNEDPAVHIFSLLFVHLGLPYFLLASTAPLLQAWFGLVADRKTSPYRLYALSNTGSLLALASYPFFVEPQFGTSLQIELWSYGFIIFTALCVLSSIFLGILKVNKKTKVDLQTRVAIPTVYDALTWFSLSAGGVIILLSITNHICHDVASIPFLWVAPLSLYLLSFIACFDSDRWYWRSAYSVTAVILILIFLEGSFVASNSELEIAISVSFLTLFCCCMVCHGELVRLKPATQYLTRFYLLLSAGGAFGGIFVSLLSPYLFSSYLELDFGLLLVLGLMVVLHGRDKESFVHRSTIGSNWSFVQLFFVGLLVAVGVKHYLSGWNVIEQGRNFYGVLGVKKEDWNNPVKRKMIMVHGRIVHGSQFVEGKRKRLPTEYFSIQSGLGTLLLNFQANRPRHIGIIGLGAGTIAAYGKPGDVFRFYEINPDVIEVAGRYFTYLKDSRAKIETVLGDARLVLEREQPRKYNILILDAFSSDSIPVHLLTDEAFSLYVRHLAEGGAIAAHVSNRHIDLRPVLRAHARKHGFGIVFFGWKGEGERRSQSDWVVFTKDTEFIKSDVVQAKAVSDEDPDNIIEWTDDYSSMLHVLK